MTCVVLSLSVAKEAVAVVGQYDIALTGQRWGFVVCKSLDATPGKLMVVLVLLKCPVIITILLCLPDTEGQGLTLGLALAGPAVSPAPHRASVCENK